jgi:hypothetical protein
MRAACIVPPAGVSLVKDNTYHLTLAHVALMSKEYSTFYKKIGRKKGIFHILDNSAYELEQPLGIDELALACDLTSPDVLVVPDSIWHPAENIRKAVEFEQNVELLREQHPRLRFMAVPHGATYDEYITNIDALAKLQYISILGLSKTAARLDIRWRLAFVVTEQYEKDVHFLGIWDNPIAEALEGKSNPRVLGIDSSYAFRLGIAGRTILEYKPTPKVIDFTFPTEKINFDWTQRQINAFTYLVESNISSEEELRQEYKNGRFSSAPKSQAV